MLLGLVLGARQGGRVGISYCYGRRRRVLLGLELVARMLVVPEASMLPLPPQNLLLVTRQGQTWATTAVAKIGEVIAGKVVPGADHGLELDDKKTVNYVATGVSSPVAATGHEATHKGSKRQTECSRRCRTPAPRRPRRPGR